MVYICKSRKWEVSINFEVFDHAIHHDHEDSSDFIGLNIGLNGTGPQKTYNLYIRVYLTWK